MSQFATLLQHGNAWLFMPSAVLLGALHGLEPGHSKTMMAAFIVAVRGTVRQAVLLGLAATVSHTAVVWVVAMAGLYFGRHWGAESNEPYFQIASGLIVLAVAAWMVWRVSADRHHDDHHDHHHDDHDHGDAHERAHARDIDRRFAGRTATTGQIVLFGLTGGLIPCPASITVLLLCLQLQQIALGATLVLCFSLGLALTLVTVGAAAAIGARKAATHWSRFAEFAQKLPYLSSVLIAMVGIYLVLTGWRGLP